MYRRSEDLCSNQINSVSCLSPPPTYFTHMYTTPANCCKICLEIFNKIYFLSAHLTSIFIPFKSGRHYLVQQRTYRKSWKILPKIKRKIICFFNRNNQLDSMVTRRGQLIRNETIFILIVKESLFKFSFTLTQNFCYDIFPI